MSHFVFTFILRKNTTENQYERKKIYVYMKKLQEKRKIPGLESW